jgi:hypothetical protein
MARTMTIAERNRAIKRTLESAFGKGKVSVRGARGTAYGWLTCAIDFTPRDIEQRNELTGLVWDLLTAAKLESEIGSYGYNDPGADYGCGRNIHINFNDCRYYRTMRLSDGSLVGRSYDGEWQPVA